MNTIECPIDESAAQRNEQKFAEFNLIIELDDSQLRQVAGGQETPACSRSGSAPRR